MYNLLYKLTSIMLLKFFKRLLLFYTTEFQVVCHLTIDNLNIHLLYLMFISSWYLLKLLKHQQHKFEIYQIVFIIFNLFSSNVYVTKTIRQLNGFDFLKNCIMDYYQQYFVLSLTIVIFPPEQILSMWHNHSYAPRSWFISQRILDVQ